MAATRKQIRYKERPYSDREIRHVLLCVVAWSGNVTAAVDQLKEEGDLEKVPRQATIHGWIRGTHAELYNEIRERSLEQMERELADRYRGVAAQAVEATEVGVRVAREFLESGEDRDPARSAASLATVADKALRDYSLLEGKPTTIQETRGMTETLRTLIDMGVLVPHAAPELEAEVEAEN